MMSTTTTSWKLSAFKGHKQQTRSLTVVQPPRMLNVLHLPLNNSVTRDVVASVMMQQDSTMIVASTLSKSFSLERNMSCPVISCRYDQILYWRKRSNWGYEQGKTAALDDRTYASYGYKARIQKPCRASVQTTWWRNFSDRSDNFHARQRFF